MRTFIFLALITFSLLSCQPQNEREVSSVVAEEIATSTPLPSPDTSIHYTYNVFPVVPGEKNSDEGFGFEISSNKTGGMRIRQESIPAVQDNHPFLSEEHAASTAMLMIQKLEKGIMPPAISVEELDSLGVIY
jgi:hypothetical protein